MIRQIWRIESGSEFLLVVEFPFSMVLAAETGNLGSHYVSRK